MALPKIIPALADLTQDIAGPLPVELLQAWAGGNQNAEEAGHLLDAYRVGGRAIGVWTADNTEMYYPSSVSAGAVVEAMAEAQARIAAGGPIRIGMCVHRGDFYEVGGGLYGHDAEIVEHLAENGAGPGDLLAFLLDGFVSNALMETVLKVSMRAGDHVAGLGGGLAILTFDTARESLDFAQAVRTRFADNGVVVKIGIDRGPVLMFSGRQTQNGISGDPVNIASKLSEDAGAVGRIRISTRALQGMPVPAGAQPFEVTASRIALTGMEL